MRRGVHNFQYTEELPNVMWWCLLPFFTPFLPDELRWLKGLYNNALSLAGAIGILILGSLTGLLVVNMQFRPRGGGETPPDHVILDSRYLVSQCGWFHLSFVDQSGDFWTRDYYNERGGFWVSSWEIVPISGVPFMRDYIVLWNPKCGHFFKECAD